MKVTALTVVACFVGVIFGRWQVEERADAVVLHDYGNTPGEPIGGDNGELVITDAKGVVLDHDLPMFNDPSADDTIEIIATEGLITNLAGEVDSELTAHIVDKYGDGFWLEPISGTGDAIEIYPQKGTGGGIDLAVEPNDSSTDAIILESTEEGYLDLNVDPVVNIVICTESGGELIMTFEDDELKITGDLDMNEAAKMFFNEFLKPMADEYIAERLK